MTSGTTSPLSPGAPVIDPHEGQPERQRLIIDLFEAAGAGNTQEVRVLCTALGLEWTANDIERFTTWARWYGPLETNGDSLITLLSTHKQGTVSVNPEMKLFMNEAVLQMTAAGQPPSPEIQATINKIQTGQPISEEEAKALHVWLLGAKEKVIPTEYRINTITQTIKQLQDTYDQYVQSGSRLVSNA